MNPPARTDPNLSGLLRSATMLAGPRLSRYPGQGNAQKTRGAVRTPSWLVSCPNYARMGLGSMVTRGTGRRILDRAQAKRGRMVAVWEEGLSPTAGPRAAPPQAFAPLYGSKMRCHVTPAADARRR